MATAADPPPNIILVLIDDQGWTGTSVQMDPELANSRSDYYQTPNLESLASQGLRFSRAYASAAVCSPTRAAILTGMSPAQLQMTDLPYARIGSSRFNAHYDQRPLSPPVPEPLDPSGMTLPRLLKEADSSYVTAHFGKWHLATGGMATALDAGYDVAQDPQRQGSEDPRAVFSIANAGKAFMADRVANGEPFYMQLSHRAVHDPIQARPETIEKYDALPPGSVHKNPSYAAMTEDLDTSLGEIFQQVKDLGIEENTYIIYTSDHGAAYPVSRNNPLYRGKATLWEGGIRVPLVVAGPGIEPGGFSQLQTASVDLYATIGELAGHQGPLPDGVEGASLVPALKNGGNLPSEDAHLVRQHAEGGALYFHWPHNFGNTRFRTIPTSAIIDGDYKLLREYGENGKQDNLYLFNLTENIEENAAISSELNLARRFPAKTQELLGKLDRWLESVDASLAYDVAADVQIAWDADRPGADPTSWRATTDVDYKGRETWRPADGRTQPHRVDVAPFQPGLPHTAFRFDGNEGFTRKFFDVGDNLPRSGPNVGESDFDRSVSFEFWVRFDSLDREQILFESGDGANGLSLTLGDGDDDGKHSELRFRVASADRQPLTVTSALDRFADPTRDFVHVAAVFKDASDDRHVTIYVNGVAATRADGLAGDEGSIIWDGIDTAGLGRMAGNGVGAANGTGNLPFSGGNLRGDMTAMRFVNYALAGHEVLRHYNEVMPPVQLGVRRVGESVQLPTLRPGDLSEGALEGDDRIVLLLERQDHIDDRLHVDILPEGGETYSGEALHGNDGALPAGTEIASYLLHFDPAGQPVSAQRAAGTVTFSQPILGVILHQESLESTDPWMGSVGAYATGPRSLDPSATDFLSLSDDLRTMTVSLSALQDQIVEFRVLTAAVPEPSSWLLALGGSLIMINLRRSGARHSSRGSASGVCVDPSKWT